MRQNKLQVFYRIYQILLSLSIAVAGICLMAGCLVIFRAGEHPFSREVVATTFAGIAGPVYLCGAMVLIGILLKPHFPAPKKKPEKNDALILSRLEATIDLNECPKDLHDAVIRLLVRRTMIQSLGWAVLALGGVVFLVLGANPVNFHTTEINGSMIMAMTWLIPCMALPFGYAVFAAYYRKRSIRKEIDLLKTAPPEAKCPPEPDPVKPDRTPWLRYGFLALALVLLFGGWFLGGATDVLTKAVNICTECIGLG